MADPRRVRPKKIHGTVRILRTTKHLEGSEGTEESIWPRILLNTKANGKDPSINSGYQRECTKGLIDRS